MFQQKRRVSVLLSMLCLAFTIQAHASNIHGACLMLNVKERLMCLAEFARGKIDDDNGTIRTVLDNAVKELLTLIPQPSFEARVKKLPGAWEQIWGPYSYGDITAIQLDPENVYQVISEQGYYYNVGYSDFFGKTITGILRGEYQVEDGYLSVRFTDNAFLANTLPSGTDLKTIAKLKEVGALKTLPLPLSESAKNPATLSETYVDDNLRVTYGGTVDNPLQTLYILKKIKTVK